MSSGRKPKQLAHIAQLVEHFLGKEEATGSSPVVSTKGQGGIASVMLPQHKIMRDSLRNRTDTFGPSQLKEYKE